MKIISLILVFHLMSSVFLAQDSVNVIIPITNKINHNYKDLSLSVSPNFLIQSNSSNHFAGGLKLKLFIGKNVSFNSDLVIGKEYFHMGPGVIGLPLWYLGMDILNSDDEQGESIEQSLAKFLFFGALMLMSVEHTAYHIPIQQTMEISPYISLLRFKSFQNSGNNLSENSLKTGGALGVEFNWYIKKIVISPYTEYNFTYSNKFSGFHTGIHCGYYFSNKRFP